MTYAVRSLHTTRAALLNLLLLAVLVPCSLAQSQTPPTTIQNLYLVRIAHVRPELAQEYNTFMRDETIPAYKKGGVKLLNTLATSLFGEDLEFISITPAASLAQFDEQSPLVKALGLAGQQAWMAKQRRLTANYHYYLAQLLPSLCFNLPKPDAPPPKGYFAVTITTVPGRMQEYESFFKSDLLPALQKAFPRGVLTAKVILGGNSGEYRVFMPSDSFAELERAIIDAGTAGLFKDSPRTASLVLRVETATYRHVPELSIRPEAQK